MQIHGYFQSVTASLSNNTSTQNSSLLHNSIAMPSHIPIRGISLSHQTCIGARLKILLHFLSLSSFPTTPFIRDPIGSPPLLISTQALSSKRTTLPSGRWYFFFVRTTTACRMSPRRTLFAADTETAPPDSGPKLRCFCTTTMMRSPVAWGRSVSWDGIEEWRWWCWTWWW